MNKMNIRRYASYFKKIRQSRKQKQHGLLGLVLLSRRQGDILQGTLFYTDSRMFYTNSLSKLKTWHRKSVLYKKHIKSQYYVAIRIHVCIKCSMIMTWIPVIVVNTGYQHCIINFLDWYCLLVSIHVHINGRTFLLSIIYRFQCLFHSAEKLLDVIKRSVPSEDADDENPVVTVYLSELFVKTQPNMTKSVSKYTCQIFF